MDLTHKAHFDWHNVVERAGFHRRAHRIGSALSVRGCQLAATVRAVGIAVALSLPCLPIQAAAQENSTDLAIVADQVRSQGFACDKPVSVERIEAEASADETVYMLKCDGVTYQVHLIPDQAARIMKVE